MIQRADPSLYRRKLLRELHKARGAAGLTQREAAEALDWSVSKIIRIETGQVGVTVTDVKALAGLYGITEPRLSDLLDAARQSKGSSWWAKHHEVLSPSFRQYLDMEGAASTLRVYQPMVVPGHLQTPDYTEALLQPRVPDGARLGKIAALRKERQDHLLDEKATIQTQFVISEWPLLQQIGSPEVMRDQLDLLLELSAHPRVTIGVLPRSFGAHYSTLSGFVLLSYPDEPDVLYIEHATGSMTNGNDMDLLNNYQLCFETISAGALHGDAATELIMRAREDVTGR